MWCWHVAGTKHALTGGRDGTMRSWDLTTGQNIRIYRLGGESVPLCHLTAPFLWLLLTQAIKCVPFVCACVIHRCGVSTMGQLNRHLLARHCLGASTIIIFSTLQKWARPSRGTYESPATLTAACPNAAGNYTARPIPGCVRDISWRPVAD